MRDLGQLQADAVAALMAEQGMERSEARLEFQMLCRAFLGLSRASLLAHPEIVPEAEPAERLQDALRRRLAGEPLAYILGEREFFGLSFKVTPATLIPRPDTETLVEQALLRLPQGGKVLDMGTGSGAIALSIAHTRPDVRVMALDASPAALAVARENAERLAIRNADFLHSDWFNALQGERYDLIVSNPPYVAEGDPHLDALRHEPVSALTAGMDGLDDIRRIVAAAPDHLHPGGCLLMEHGYDQAEAVRALLSRRGFVAVDSVRDLGGVERVTLGYFG